MPRVVPLPQHELEICDRVKKVREWIGLSRVEFASDLGVETSVVARCELGRVPLKYSLGCKIVSVFGVGPQWLARFVGPAISYIDLPLAEDLGVSPDAPFSRVFSDVLESKFATVFQEERQKVQSSVSDFIQDLKRASPPTPEGRRVALETLRIYMFQWVCQIPDTKFTDFYIELLVQGIGLVEKLGRDPTGVVAARTEALSVAYLKRRNAEQKLPRKKSSVDKLREVVEKDWVRFTWKQLKARLKSATEPRGKRAELARAIGSSQSNLNGWLDEDREPGAEATFRLLEWVTAEEAKQQSSEGASTPAEPKTQPKDTNESKLKSGRKKK